MKWTAVLRLLCLTATLLWPRSTPAFETSTHDQINQQAALGLVMTDSGQTFDDFLRIQLLFSQGLDTPVNGHIIRDWFGIGGVAEDQYLPETLGQKLAEIAGGATRSPRHFHTPLRTWDQSGLNLGGVQFESSPRWAQLADQGFTGKAAWGDARSTYFQALTATDPGQRATLFGNTFKILGQLMHVVVDMGSVAHTRNDQHILGDPFETFVNEPINQSLIAGYQGMDPSYVRFTPTNDAVATVPVARLWDTDTYSGSNPEITAQTTTSGATVGLAEFTSANFFSRSTVSKTAGADPVLPYPATDQLVPGPIELYEPTNNNRQYWSKGTGQGIAITHMAVEGAFNLFEPSTWQRFSLDNKVFEDYAHELLPRAIGYAGGLLDYFFRSGIVGGGCCLGTLADILEGRATVWPTNTALSANNVSLEDLSTGSVTLVLGYMLGNTVGYMVSSPVALDLPAGTGAGPIAFDFSGSNAPGPGVSAIPGVGLPMFFVYRGRFGLEENAVCVGQGFLVD